MHAGSAEDHPEDVGGAILPRHAGPLTVPPKWRKVGIDEVPMPNSLYNALVARGVRTLGELIKLTLEELGSKFGAVRQAALRELVRSLTPSRSRA
jgi:hypothetical protein